MPLNLRDVRIALFAVEGSLQAVDGHAGGPLGDIGDYLAFRALFARAGAAQDGLDLPWDPSAPAANLLWANYVTNQLHAAGDAEAQARIAWNAIVPLKVAAGPSVPALDPRLKPAFGEAFVWPTGIGFCHNYSVVGDIAPAELGALVVAVRGQVRRHDLLNGLRDEVWGKGLQAGVHSELGAVVSVVQADPASASSLDDPEALEALLAGFEADEAAQNLTDRPLGNGGVYGVDGLRLIWLPGKFRSTRRPLHAIGCFHRNMVFGSLQAQLLAMTARQLDALKGAGSLPTSYDSTIDRLRACMGKFWSPYFTAWFEADRVVRARKALAL